MTLRVRRLREQMTAVYQYVLDLESPLREEVRQAPSLVGENLADILRSIDALDRTLAKIDGRPGGVGGEVILREEWK